MTTYRTNNAIGSTDPRDLYDNSENLDEFVNSKEKTTHPDRLGVPRQTWRGMEQRFAVFLANSGYQFVGDYQAGIEITEYNQLIRDADGELWRLSARIDIPYTTTGAGMPEDDAFVSVGDAALRQELGSQSDEGVGAELVGYRGQSVREALDKRAIYAETLADLLALPPGRVVDGQVAICQGGVFSWSENLNRWRSGGRVTPEIFGALGDGVADDSIAFSYLSEYLEDWMTVFCVGTYRLEHPVYITSSARWEFSQGSKIINDLPRTGSRHAIHWRGEAKGGVGLTTDVKKGGVHLSHPGAASLFEKGDLVVLSSGKILSDTRDPTVYESEQNLVLDVSGDIVTLRYPCYFAYSSGDSPYVTVSRPISGLVVNGISVENTPGMLREGILISHFNDVKILNGHFRNGAKGIFCNTGVNGLLEDCGADEVNEGLGYALQFASTRNPMVVRPYGSGCRHSVEFSGNCLDTIVEDCMASNSTAAILSWHPGPENNTVTGGVFDSEIIMRGQVNTVQGAKFRSGSYITFGETQRDNITEARSGTEVILSECDFSDNEGVGLGTVRFVHPAKEVIIRNNKFLNGSFLPLIRFLSGAEGVYITNNLLDLRRDFVTFDSVDLGIEGSMRDFRDISLKGNSGKVGRFLIFHNFQPESDPVIDKLTVGGNSIDFIDSNSRIVSLGNAYAKSIAGFNLRNNMFTGLNEIAEQLTGSSLDNLVVHGNSAITGVGGDRYFGETSSEGEVVFVIPMGARPPAASPAIFTATVPDGYRVSSAIPNIDGENRNNAAIFRVFNAADSLPASGVSVTAIRVG